MRTPPSLSLFSPPACCAAGCPRRTPSPGPPFPGAGRRAGAGRGPRFPGRAAPAASAPPEVTSSAAPRGRTAVCPSVRPSLPPEPGPGGSRSPRGLRPPPGGDLLRGSLEVVWSRRATRVWVVLLRKKVAFFFFSSVFFASPVLLCVNRRGLWVIFFFFLFLSLASFFPPLPPSLPDGC